MLCARRLEKNQLTPLLGARQGPGIQIVLIDSNSFLFDAFLLDVVLIRLGYLPDSCVEFPWHSFFSM